MNSLPLFDLEEKDWDEAGRATLGDFIHMVANTPLKIRILNEFLYDPYLCLESMSLALRLEEDPEVVVSNVRELCAAGAFHYCPSYAYSDMCSLSFGRHTPAMQHCLRLLRLALRIDPKFVWGQVDVADLPPQPIND